jgi:2-dehydro-3-deoxygalactonokinase
MTAQLFIAGEWGSVSMRLTLCERNGDNITALETRTGRGVIGCSNFEAAFFEAAEHWFLEHGAMPVILAGMIGSNLGWHDSGYVTCPAGVTEIRRNLSVINTRGVNVYFSPGLKTKNIFGLPDVVRGEEMAALGWLNQYPDEAPRLLCLPGRHVKWLLTEGGRITSFFTGMCGELEDLLLTHGLLGKGVNREASCSNAYRNGVSYMVSNPLLSIGHSIFATRSRLVLGEHTKDEASSFLQGLLIGSDVRDAFKAYELYGQNDKTIYLMDHASLTSQYKLAIDVFGYSTAVVSEHSLGIIGLAKTLR